MRIGSITIPESEGQILFNQAIVSSNAEIAAINSGGAGAANFSSIITGGESEPPLIEIRTTFDPDVPDPDLPNKSVFPPSSIQVVGQEILDDEGEVIAFLGLENLRGTIRVYSAAGDTLVQAPIVAGNIDITSGRNFILLIPDADNDGNPDPVYHVGGSPTEHFRTVRDFLEPTEQDSTVPPGGTALTNGYGLELFFDTSLAALTSTPGDSGRVVVAQLNDNGALNILIRMVSSNGANMDYFYSDDVNHPEYNAAVIDLIDYIDANAGVSEGRFNFSVSDWSAFELTTSQINQIVSDATTITGHTLSNLVERALSIEGNGVVALNRVAISAPYLNINGDIQSGNPDRSVLINLDQSYIDGLEAQYRSDPEQGSLIEISEDVIGNIAVYYNAELDRLEVRRCEWSAVALICLEIF